MKKALRLTIMAALVVLICLPSCTKPEKQIIGKWKITYAKADGYNDGDAKGEVWTFKENGKFNGYISWGKKDDSYVDCNWYVDGNELVLKGGDLEVSGYGWSETVVLTLDIEQLDKNNLVVSGKMKDEYYEDGEYDTYSSNVAYELEAK